MSDKPVLEVKGLTKRYGQAIVLDQVDLEVHRGKIHALLGENGAGKSTLIKIVSGAVQPDSGQILLDGHEMNFRSPLEATTAGISTVHQELAVVPGLSVAENVFLGQPTPTRLGMIRWNSLNKRASVLMQRLGMNIDVTRDVSRLAPIGQTMVALARAMWRKSKVLILDEPTSVFTNVETEHLLAALAEITGTGIGVVYVSHRISEVMATCDRWTVLRNGKNVGTGSISQTDERSLIELMAGRRIEAVFPQKSAARQAAANPVLRLSNLKSKKLRGVSFDVDAGDVIGIAGLAGSGRSELLGILAGARQTFTGSIEYRGRPFSPRSVAEAQRAGVVLVPQERRSEALIPDSVLRNLNLTSIDDHTRLRFVASPRIEHQNASALARAYHVRAVSLRQEVLTLSGGNQQKVVLARFLGMKPDLVLLDEPTRGVDVATRAEIYRLIRRSSAEGRTFIIVSSEIPELLGLCDKVVALHLGLGTSVFDAAEITEREILHACYGRTA